MFYTHYRGRSCGRILGYLELCCSLRYAEECVVHKDKITFFDKTVGFYKWIGETDYAEIDFKEDFHRAKFMQLKPFIDNRNLQYNLSYMYQELCRYLRYNLGGETTIKKMLPHWWYAATQEDINKYYPTLVSTAGWLNKNYYEERKPFV